MYLEVNRYKAEDAPETNSGGSPHLETPTKRAANTGPRTFPRKVGWIALAIAGILAIGYGAIVFGMHAVLSSDKLREKIGQKTGVILHANAGYLPIQADGLALSCSGLLANGKPPSPLSVLEARGLLARCSLAGLWRRVWTIDELHVEQLQAAYGSTAQDKYFHSTLKAKPPEQPPVDGASPIRVEIRKVFVDRLDLNWGKAEDSLGFVQGVKAQCTTTGAGGKEVEVQGKGGRFQQANWPQLNIESLRLRYAKPNLRLEHADLRQPENGGGGIALSGQARFEGDTAMDISLLPDRCQIVPFLPKNWRGKLEGVFGGKVALHKQLNIPEAMRVEGELELTNGLLQSVDALDKVASITQKPEFRHLHLKSVHARFRFDKSCLEANAFHAEAKGLLCVEGAFTIEKERIDGTFQLGTTAGVLAPIPGAREKVFTDAHDGYLWTTVKVTGPMAHPQDNLKARLIKAAEEQAPATLLAPVIKPGEGILELLRRF